MDRFDHLRAIDSGEPEHVEIYRARIRGNSRGRRRGPVRDRGPALDGNDTVGVVGPLTI